MEKSFTDSETDVISFSRTGGINKITKDCGISTTEIIATDQSTQAVLKQNVEIQTEKNASQIQPQYDEDALLDFMRRISPKVEDELRKRNKYFGADFNQNLSDENEVATKKLYDLKKHEIIGDLKSKHLSWNCYSNKLAVSFGYKKHESWCKHTSYILIYECNKNEEFKNEAKEYIEVNTCVVDLQFHPVLSSVLVFATEEGKIYWHNTTENMENNSKNYIYHKNEKITQISWVYVDSSLYLAVAGSDSCLYLWLTSAFINDWKVHRIFTFKSAEDTIDRAVQRFEFSKLNSTKFVIALEGGMLFYCSTNSVLGAGDLPSYPVISNFDCPKVVINDVCFSSFEENLFVISSIDQKLRVYQLNEKSPIYVIATEYAPLGVKWSHLQEDTFLTWAADGDVKFLNYRKCIVVKSLKFTENMFAAAFKVKGMKQLIAIGDSDCITIWQTTLFVR